MPRIRKPAFIPQKSKATLSGVVFKAGLTVFIAFGLLSLLVWFGNKASTAVEKQTRYEVATSTILVDPPAGIERTIFLNEVRAFGDLPEQISAVAKDTPDIIATAFAKHPWVSTVKRVHVDNSKTIHVELTYRVPVLAFPTTGDPPYRMIDKTGMVLPPAKLPELIAIYKVDSPRSQPPAGKPIGDEAIKRAAELVEIYKNNQPRVIEKTAAGWRITPLTGKALLVSW